MSKEKYNLMTLRETKVEKRRAVKVAAFLSKREQRDVSKAEAYRIGMRGLASGFGIE